MLACAYISHCLRETGDALSNTASSAMSQQAEATHEPLKISGIDIDAAAADAIAKAWREVSSARASLSVACSSSSSGRRGRPGRNSAGGSLYASAEQFLELVRQVLSRDIRSLHQRLHEFTAQTLYHVILEGGWRVWCHEAVLV